MGIRNSALAQGFASPDAGADGPEVRSRPDDGAAVGVGRDHAQHQATDQAGRAGSDADCVVSSESWEILVGDCREILGTLPEQSVQCVVTSPPYYGLRDYGVDGQLGLEDSLKEYVAEIADELGVPVQGLMFT